MVGPPSEKYLVMLHSRDPLDQSVKGVTPLRGCAA